MSTLAPRFHYYFYSIKVYLHEHSKGMLIISVIYDQRHGVGTTHTIPAFTPFGIAGIGHLLLPHDTISVVAPTYLNTHQSLQRSRHAAFLSQVVYTATKNSN